MFEEWASTSNAFRVVPLSDKKFRKYYADRNWNFDHVKLKGPCQFFKGPKPGGTYESNKGLVYKVGNFWLLYWTPKVLQRICNQSKLYAK